ncbi:carbon-nitrogen hydrolase family protein [Fredinandcohnia humi]
MKELTVSLAQISVGKGDISGNVEKHCEFIRNAAEYDTDYILFPELSLTGYELELAESLAFTVGDERLLDIKECCITYKVNAIVGAPIKTRLGVQIGSLVILSNGAATIYSKHFLHPGEEEFVIPGKLNPLIHDYKETIAFAICADSSKEDHRMNAYENGASVYMSSAFITPGGYRKDTEVLQEMARQYQMTVFMANYCGETGGLKAAGGSCAWSSTGEVIGKLENNQEALFILKRDCDRIWRVNGVYYTTIF